MDETKLNLEIRRFLKTFGVAAQRDIERAVREAVSSGKIKGNERLAASAVLEIRGLGKVSVLDDAIALG